MECILTCAPASTCLCSPIVWDGLEGFYEADYFYFPRLKAPNAICIQKSFGFKRGLYAAWQTGSGNGRGILWHISGNGVDFGLLPAPERAGGKDVLGVFINRGRAGNGAGFYLESGRARGKVSGRREFRDGLGRPTPSGPCSRPQVPSPSL